MQEDVKSTSLSIEPELQEFIDGKIKIAQATFAKDTDEQTLRNTMLLYFAGIGLVRADHSDDGFTWVRTGLLVELERGPTRPFDLTPFMTMTMTKGDNLPCMVESLRLIIADMITVGKQQHLGWAEQNGVDIALLTLAGKGLASVMEGQDGNWVWHANPELIDAYQMGGGTRKPKLILDKALKGIQKALTKLVEVETGQRKVPKRMKRMSTIIALIGQELSGLAVAYKDPKGRLAWKASAQLLPEHDPEPEIVA
jgi:hypothetical protein